MKNKIINIEKKVSRYTILSLIALTIFTKFFGFFREIVFGYYFGTNDIADIYRVIQQIPLIFITFIGQGLNTGVIPIYSGILNKDGKDKANDFLNAILSFLLIISFITTIFVMIFPKQFILLFASGFNQNKIELAQRLLKLAIISINFSVFKFVLIPFLQINDKFLITSLISIPLNIVYIISFAFSFNYNKLTYLSYGIIIAELVQIVMLIPKTSKCGFLFEFKRKFLDKNVKSLFKLAIPIIISVSLQAINFIIDKNMASFLEPVGGIASLDFSNKIILLVHGVFTFSIISVVFPKISKSFVEYDIKGINEITNNAIIYLSITILPCMFALFFLSEPIIRFIYQRGAFNERSVLLTSDSLLFYSFSIYPIALREIITRIFYSLKDTKTPMVNSLISIAINIILNFILSKIFGLKGLAMATSISSIIVSLLLMLNLSKKHSLKIIKISTVISIFKIGFCSFFISVFASLQLNYINKYFNPKLSLIIVIIVSAILYFISLLFIRIPEIDRFKNEILRKI